VSVDNAVHRPAVAEEQAYLHARDDHLAAIALEPRHRVLRLIGYATFAMGLLVTGVGLISLARQLFELFSVTEWRYPIAACVIVISLGAIFTLLIKDRINGKALLWGLTVIVPISTVGLVWPSYEGKASDIFLGALTGRPYHHIAESSPTPPSSWILRRPGS
jgi:TctA family transporter